jgi:hypothetical protein
MTQPILFDVPLPFDIHVDPREQPRLSAQCERILARLQRGSASNRELAVMALNYKARISDLRKAGYTVECFDRNHKTGLSWYRLTEGA